MPWGADGSCRTEGLGEAGEKRDMQDRRFGSGG